ncbi:DUF5819 family protein [Streptomyces sp. ST2-7A]|uniref:DUF5819 family protein n=1 Tax=Streptomyces sp. ST2-7A TaxID=2907214 RepID=UPI001F36071E|nr:DUF5819 family protein [Streptomyces sp. ST2-7A]MCE7083177.1 DUF5819 family protein [Streptomyces sp. ST2-7A]
MPSGVEQAESKESGHSDGGSTAGGRRSHRGAGPPRRPPHIFTGAAVVLCLAVTLIHVTLVFLHVAPANAISQQYNKQIDAWVYPVFEQNWRLFAPDPESVNRQISARTMRIDPDGSEQVSDWFDLSDVDNSATEHNPFPSHTTQNMLRRAWNAYFETLGTDDEPRSERAAMIRQYLRNIAVDRVTEYRGDSFDFIQLRVVAVPVGAPGGSNRPATPVETRHLPWWEVTPRGTD